ncbi:hypothetical protein DESUT3_20970 [Desulfuromonas versatilis]|uniref:Uncharacterized protein n=1 Tax=Desulfuromonas versatilis TaxID=2802975 RepID=A0ABN6DY06_9BACT|nr:hypothetical protein DESUT3_20970 [Desulfuromonas versatilis]
MKTVFTLALAAFFAVAAGTAGAQNLPIAEIPAALHPGFDHLLGLTARGAEFVPEKIAGVLDFAAAPQDPKRLLRADKRKGTTSAFYQFDLHTDLEQVLRLAFNPEIPAHALMPSSVRMTRWVEIEGGESRLAGLADALKNSAGAPLVVRGVEHEEITPNLSTGTYFSYDLKRAMVLWRYQGRPVLISISRQADRSSVGKQGLVLGRDNDWDYFYSGIDGVTRMGLGWVRSYMYDSFSILVFQQLGDSVRVAGFKWLSAGSLKLNLVNEHHIHEGLVRYARDLREVLESSKLPLPAEVSRVLGEISKLAPDQLRERYRRHLDDLARRHGSDSALTRDKFADLLHDPNWVLQLPRESLEADLVLGYMKCLLGRTCLFPEALR